VRARPLCITVLGFLLGILVVLTQNKWIVLPAIGMFLWLVCCIRKEESKVFAYGKLLLYVIAFLFGSSRMEKQQAFRANYESMLCDGKKIVLQGELEEKEYKNNSYIYYLKNCYLKLEPDTVLKSSNVTGGRIFPCNQVIVEMENDIVSIGKVLVLEGNVTTFRQARNEGNFDERSYYQSQKIDFKLKNAVIKKQYGKEASFRELLFQLRQRLKRIYLLCMSAENSGVITMMTLGDKSLMDSEIKELYQRVGISHVLAISGLHISVIGMTLYKFLRKVCGSFMISGILAGVFMFTYGVMTGFRPSSTRAIIMFFMMLTAQALGRTYDSLSALSLSAMFLLWENPFLLIYAGFLFSYGAVLGVVLLGNVVTKVFEEKHKIRDAIYSSFSIQLVTVPLTAYFYYEVPVYGMLVNFLVLPLMSVLLFLGLTGGFIGLLWLEGARLILIPCQLILLFYQKLSTFVQSLPRAVYITGQPELWRMIVFYSALAVLVYCVRKRRQIKGYLILGVMLLAFVLHLPRGGMEVSVLDIGQGDGIYLRTSSEQDIFIDGGSSNVSKVGTYRILPFLKYNGVRKIDYWFVSHADEDHISGLKEMLEEGYPVDNLVFSESVVRDEAYDELVLLAEETGTEVIYMGYLDSLHLGAAKLTCVFPHDDFATNDKNAASLVLYYQDEEFDGLFTGDISTDEERWIAMHCRDWLEVCLNECEDNDKRANKSKENIGIKKEIDFYKVAHHGSKYSNGKLILESLQPKVAVVSAGINNRYGHPHADTLERLENVGCEVWNTAESGQVTLDVDADIVVTTRLSTD